VIEMRKRILVILVLAAMLLQGAPRAYAAEELLPKYIDAKTQKAIKNGLDYLAKTQGDDGNWTNGQDCTAYPVTMAALGGMAFLANGNTPNRGPYADNVRRVVQYLITQGRPNGLITSSSEESGMPMHGHGFALMFMAQCYGMETDERNRAAMKKIVNAAIDLTARAQSNYGGWTYSPGGGDEGSVTVTQIQGLRAAQNAGFTVPKGTIEEAVKYLERCKTPEGGIQYSLGSGGGPRIAISAAAIATLYNAGDYDSKLADACLNYVKKQFDQQKNNWSKGGGHDFYTHLYASQAFYQAGDKYWDEYFPGARDQLLRMQARDGSWQGDGIGNIYGTSIALVILQLPYKFLPIYQR
jgi:prenyltransferase beta subunit